MKPNWRRINRLDGSFRRLARPQLADLRRASQEPSSSPRRRPLRNGQGRNSVEQILCSKAAIKSMAASVHVQRHCSQQRMLREALGTRHDVLMKDLRSCIKSIEAKQQADHMAAESSSSLLAQLEAAAEDATQKLNEVEERRIEVDDSVAKAMDLSMRYAMDAVRISMERLEEHEMIVNLECVVNVNEINQSLFGQSQGETGGNPEHSEVEDEQEADTGHEYEVIKDSVSTARIKAQQRLEAHREQLLFHQENYNLALTHHLQGIDPNVPGWTAAWSREEFDINYLRRGMIISGDIRTAEEAYLRTLEQARELRLSPLSDQEEAFPDLTDDGASNLSRNAAGNDGTHPKVKAFCEGLPSSPVQPPVDQNEQRPSSSPQIPVGLHPWESMSATATPRTRRRIDEVNAIVRMKSSSPRGS